MAVVELNWNPSDRQLRQFGYIALLALPLLGWFFSGMPGFSGWRVHHTYLVGGLAGLGIVMALVGYLRPPLLKPLYFLASIIAFPIGLVLSEVILLLIYVLVFVPAGLLARAIGYDPLQRTIRRNAPTYWEAKGQAKDVASYYRQS